LLNRSDESRGAAYTVDRDRSRCSASSPRSLAASVSVVLAAVSFMLAASALASPASASHGFWHHNSHIYDPSSSTYAAYSHTTSSSWSDFLVAQTYVYLNGYLVSNRLAQCGPINGGCKHAITSTFTWNQGGFHEVDSRHCGRAGSHHISGGPDGANVCANNDEQSHWHITYWSD